MDGIPIFQDLRPDQRQKFSDYMDRRHLVVKEAGEPIYTQGDASNACMYIVRKGSVSLSQSHNEAGPGGDGGAEGGLGEHVDALADDMDDRYV